MDEVTNNSVHLCESCGYDYPNCPEECEIIFGDGTGNDNVCCCNCYEPLRTKQMDVGMSSGIKKVRPIAKIKESYGEDGRAPGSLTIVYNCPTCGRYISTWREDTACDKCGTFYDWGKSEPKIEPKIEVKWE